MHERLKASEVGQIECQTCEKKNLCSKKNFRENFFEIFFMESYPYIYFELFIISSLFHIIKSVPT